MPNLSPEDESWLLHELDELGLGSQSSRLVAEAVECVWLTLGEPTPGKAHQSRVGGAPDLALVQPWPDGEAGFANFLMQVNLAELPSLLDVPLPTRGLLAFFVAAEADSTNLDTRVLFSPPTAMPRQELDADELAIEDYASLRPHQVKLGRGIDVPGFGSKPYRQLIASEANTETIVQRYERLTERLTPDGAVIGKLLGYTSAADGDLRVNAALASTGRGDHIHNARYRKEHEDELTRLANEWRSLWRIDSNDAVGLQIWGNGRFHVLIRNDDLARGDFGRVYTEIEVGT